jgi:hypothetical protein
VRGLPYLLERAKRRGHSRRAPVILRRAIPALLEQP